jgi:hypothetical protein
MIPTDEELQAFYDMLWESVTEAIERATYNLFVYGECHIDWHEEIVRRHHAAALPDGAWVIHLMPDLGPVDPIAYCTSAHEMYESDND